MDDGDSGAPAASRSARMRLVRAGVPLSVFGIAVIVAFLAAPVPTLTWQANVVTGGIGVLAAVVVGTGGLGRTGRAAKPVTVRSAAPWLVLAGAITVLEVATLAAGSRPEFPTVSHLLGPQFTDQTVRFVGYVIWLCTGYWLVRR